MSRLYDRLGALGTKPLASGGLEAAAGEAPVKAIAEADRSRGLARAVPIDVSNVLSYVYQTRLEDSVASEELFNVAPPFEYMFVEASVPSYMRTPKGVLPKTNSIGRYGVYVGSGDFSAEEDPARSIADELGRWKCAGVEGMDLSEARWLLRLRPYIETVKGSVYGPLGVAFVTVRGDGSIVTVGGGDGYHVNTLGIRPWNAPEGASQTEVAGSLRDDILDPMLYAFLFLHAGNVELVANDPPQKASRKHERRYGRPLTRYYTLDIEPFKEVLEREGGAATEGLRKALHLCRGHFRRPKNSPPDAPQTQWVRSHMRGSTLSGEIRKDYRLGVGETDSEPEPYSPKTD